MRRQQSQTPSQETHKGLGRGAARLMNPPDGRLFRCHAQIFQTRIKSNLSSQTRVQCVKVKVRPHPQHPPGGGECGNRKCVRCCEASDCPGSRGKPCGSGRGETAATCSTGLDPSRSPPATQRVAGGCAQGRLEGAPASCWDGYILQ